MVKSSRSSIFSRWPESFSLYYIASSAGASTKGSRDREKGKASHSHSHTHSHYQKSRLPTSVSHYHPSRSPSPVFFTDPFGAAIDLPEATAVALPIPARSNSTATDLTFASTAPSSRSPSIASPTLSEPEYHYQRSPSIHNYFHGIDRDRPQVPKDSAYDGISLPPLDTGKAPLVHIHEETPIPARLDEGRTTTPKIVIASPSCSTIHYLFPGSGSGTETSSGAVGTSEATIWEPPSPDNTASTTKTTTASPLSYSSSVAKPIPASYTHRGVSQRRSFASNFILVDSPDTSPLDRAIAFPLPPSRSQPLSRSSSSSRLTGSGRQPGSADSTSSLIDTFAALSLAVNSPAGTPIPPLRDRHHLPAKSLSPKDRPPSLYHAKSLRTLPKNPWTSPPSMSSSTQAAVEPRNDGPGGRTDTKTAGGSSAVSASSSGILSPASTSSSPKAIAGPSRIRMTYKGEKRSRVEWDDVASLSSFATTINLDFSPLHSAETLPGSLVEQMVDLSSTDLDLDLDSASDRSPEITITTPLGPSPDLSLSMAAIEDKIYKHRGPNGEQSWPMQREGSRRPRPSDGGHSNADASGSAVSTSRTGSTHGTGWYDSSAKQLPSLAGGRKTLTGEHRVIYQDGPFVHRTEKDRGFSPQSIEADRCFGRHDSADPPFASYPYTLPASTVAYLPAEGSENRPRPKSRMSLFCAGFMESDNDNLPLPLSSALTLGPPAALAPAPSVALSSRSRSPFSSASKSMRRFLTTGQVRVKRSLSQVFATPEPEPDTLAPPDDRKKRGKKTSAEIAQERENLKSTIGSPRPVDP